MTDQKTQKLAFARSRSNAGLGSAISLVLFFAIANFGWQWFQDAPNYADATERTYFQAWALLLAWAQWR